MFQIIFEIYINFSIKKKELKAMELYSQRHGIRKAQEKTSDISAEAYKLLLNCCEKYYNNLAWEYSEECRCNECVSLNYDLFDTALRYKIPSLFRKNEKIAAPEYIMDVSLDEYDQFALIDLIEYIASECRDFIYEEDIFCRHYHMLFTDSNDVFQKFKNEINNIFDILGLSYILNDNKKIERILQNNVLTKEMEKSINNIKEEETKNLLQEAIDLHKSPFPNASKYATEKIWDAFERLKTYYTNTDKKKSAEAIVNDISNNNQDFIKLFNDEFKKLTEIGNNYRIRHHETNKMNITDDRYYDYFFNRCLSLISLAIQYLK